MQENLPTKYVVKNVEDRLNQYCQYIDWMVANLSSFTRFFFCQLEYKIRLRYCTKNE